MIEKIDEMKDQ